ncbi:MAG: hemin uptake protein HemP [Reyranella sp.]|uniref:hemin uptake protein HemP n=1 Tax=Reyranella sp. TaxID=1929291 RepID=UPI001ACCFC7A|nr:hemin uptake protein HemP [Reyranella sp.]MBN9086352.1 hemin uptake protein HemP [Reyranella sp.]
MTSTTAEGASQPQPPLAVRVRPLRISTDRLMGGRREIVLQHGLEEYRLRITSAGKLLLTK